MIRAHHCLIMVSVGNEAEAKLIAKALVEQQAAACVQLMPIQSTYVWEGKFECDAEFLLLIKTRTDFSERVEQIVNSLHSYDVAEVISFDISEGSHSYLEWIDQMVR